MDRAAGFKFCMRSVVVPTLEVLHKGALGRGKPKIAYVKGG